MCYADAPYADRPFADVENLAGFADGKFDATATFKYVIYAATRPLTANFNDSVAPNRFYAGTLEVPLSIDWSVLGGADIGTFTMADGETVLKNVDGRYDDLPQIFTANGRPVEIDVMRRGDDLAQAMTVFRGVMKSWFISESAVAIKVTDFRHKLQVPALPNVYAGTGGVEGGSDVKGKRKPRGVGRPRNVSSVLIDAANLVYQPHDGAVSDITAVYDRGVALTKGSDHASYAALIAAVVAPGTFATCNALGLHRLGSSPTGQVTADYRTSIDTTADAIRWFVEEATDLAYASDFYAPSFEAINIAQPAPIDEWLGLDDPKTVADVCANLARGIGGWFGSRPNALFELQRFVAPTESAAAATGSFSRTEILSITREPLPSAYSPPPKRYRARYALNFTVQNDLAGSVSAATKSFVENAFRLAATAAADATAIAADYPDAQDPEPLQTYFRNEADALAEANRQLARDRVERALYRVRLPRRALALHLGEQIRLTYPRWDLSVGRNAVLLRRSVNLQPPRDGQIDAVECTVYG